MLGRVRETVSGQFSSILGMVSAGLGVSLVPEMAVEKRRGCTLVPLFDERAVPLRRRHKLERALHDTRRRCLLRSPGVDLETSAMTAGTG
jgi:DNA-binding transcriptional LysR family regulator